MALVRLLYSPGLVLALLAASCGGAGKSPVADSGGAGGTSGSSSGGHSAKSGTSGGGKGGSGSSGTGGHAAAPANDACEDATVVMLSADEPHMDIAVTTVNAGHDIDAPCAADSGPDVFYQVTFSRRVFLYADTFGGKFDTVLFLLSDACEPLLTATTPGDALCSDDECDTSQSRVVALLDPGRYRIGLGGSESDEGKATLHLEWTLAGNGAAAELPAGNSVQKGTTTGSGNIDSRSASCLAASGENSYWWASCPSDSGGTLQASTCGGAKFETVLETAIPAGEPYTCALDSCGLQTSLDSVVPEGAGLRVLSLDGEGAGDVGEYTLTVTRP